MARKLVIDLPDGTRQLLTEVLADDELQLQEQLKLHPELLPLEELGLVGPAVVVGRESALDSGRVDLVLLATAATWPWSSSRPDRRIPTSASASPSCSTTDPTCGE